MSFSLINFIKRHKITFSFLLLLVLAPPFILPMPMRCFATVKEARGGLEPSVYAELDCYSIRQPEFQDKKGMLRYHWAFFPEFDRAFRSSPMYWDRTGDQYRRSDVVYHI